MPTTCAVASSEHPIAVQAAGAAADGVVQRLGEAPDLALLFVTAPHVASFDAAVNAVRDVLEPRALAAITAVSFVGGPRELEQRPAVSLFAARFDGADGADRPVALRLPAGHADLAVQQLAEAGVDPHGPPRALVLLPDPFTFPVEEFLDALHRWAPGITVVGGMASAARAPGGNRLALDGDAFEDGAVAVLLPAGVATSAIVSQGCRPIGDPMVVTKADGTLVEELASEPALPKLMKLITSFSEADRALAAHGLHLGRVVDEGKENHERGDFLVRNVLGAIKDRAALAVGDEISVGTTVQFQVRDAESADEDLKALLADRTASGALLFTCNDRGKHLFGTRTTTPPSSTPWRRGRPPACSVPARSARSAAGPSSTASPRRSCCSIEPSSSLRSPRCNESRVRAGGRSADGRRYVGTVIAKTTAGPVAGVDKGGVVQFRGIPYARADRFGPPGPVEAWSGTRECATFGPIAPQNAFGVEAMLAGGLPATSEDCLTLNVFTPAADDLARPVLVWVHGGAFTAGSGTMPWYNGTRLVEHGDVVVVTFNYRLGALGFLALDAYPGSGNNGLRDQMAALEWVRDNVAAFGGDPGNVTLFGESAGAMSIGALLGAPAAAGLFHRAVLQSGAAENVHRAERAAWVTERFLAAAGAGPGDGDGSTLIDRSVDELLAAQAAVSAEVSSAGGEFLPFTPVVDGLVLPRHPLDAVRAGAAAGIRVLAGTTADEWNLFALSNRNRAPLDHEGLTQLVARAAGADRAEECLGLYRSSRPEASPDQLWSAVLTDRVFRMPAIRLVEAQAAHQRATWMYLFTYRSTAFDGVLGACHTIDVPFVFDNVGRRGVEVLLGAVDHETRALSAATSQAWLAMARRGSPSHAGLPEWPPYSSTRRAVMGLGRTCQVLDDPASAERHFWGPMAPA